MAKTQYNKTPKSFDGQVQLLKSRGLNIENEDRAKKILGYISYNRLSNYWYPLLKEPKDQELFKEGAKFNTAFRLYQFDSDFRAITFQAIEQIEIGVRTQLIYHLSIKHNSGYWYEDPGVFKHYPTFVSLLEQICRSTERSKQEFIKNYRNKYEQFLPPAWKAFELLTFTNLLTILKQLKDYKDIIPISKAFGLNHGVFLSWIEVLVYIRNICAHHSRLWNIKLTISPVWPKSPKGPWVKKWENDNSNIGTKDKVLKIYAVICIITYCLNKVNPYNKYGLSIIELLDKYKEVDTAHMGFPINWKEDDLWKSILSK